LSGNDTRAASENEDGTAAWGSTDFELSPGNAVLNAGAEGFGSGFLGGKASGKALSEAGSGSAIGYFLMREHAFEEAVAIAFDGARDTRNFNQVDARSDQHDATVAQGESFSSNAIEMRLKSSTQSSDVSSVRDIAEQSRGQKGWELSLVAVCDEDAARTVRFLTGAVMACGGFVLSRRFDAGQSAAIEFEFVRATCVEMYSVLIAAGLELTAQSHVVMATLCQCTRETLEMTAGDPVRVELIIRKAGVLPLEPGGAATPPQVA
jgi:hypothetical protein